MIIVEVYGYGNIGDEAVLDGILLTLTAKDCGVEIIALNDKQKKSQKLEEG